MKLLLTILALSMLVISCSTGNKKVLLNKEEEVPFMSFVPEGYDTLDVVRGDLNKDGVSDLVLVLKDERETSADDANDRSDADDSDRLVRVLFHKGAGWELAATAKHIVWCNTCGGPIGDPYVGMTIKNGVLTVEMNGGTGRKWESTTKFRYQNGDFYLIGAKMERFNALDSCGYESEDINYLTGDRIIQKESPDCRLEVDKKDKIQKRQLVRMTEMKIGSLNLL